MTSRADWDPYSTFYDEKYHTAKLQRDWWGGCTMPYQTVNNVSILPENLPSREDPRHPVHYIHNALASSQALFDVNHALNNHIFRDLMSDNTFTYTLNEADFESGRVAVTSHLTSNNHSGVDIDNLASRLRVGRDTALITLESTNQQGLRRYNFSMGVRRLRS